jgi:hypothetical protein
MSSSNDDEHNVPTERGRQGAAVGVQEREQAAGVAGAHRRRGEREHGRGEKLAKMKTAMLELRRRCSRASLPDPSPSTSRPLRSSSAATGR